MSLPPLPQGLGNFGGAFDLGSLRRPAVNIAPEDLGYVLTQNNLISELLPASHEAVAIVLCWSPRSTQAQSLLPMLRQFNSDDSNEAGDPTWIFATVNVDAEPAVAKALQVQSVPLAIAIIQEQLVPLFESVPAADQVRAVITKVLELAAQKGLGTGKLPTPEAEPGIEPEEESAMKALEVGDYATAKQEYLNWLKRAPANEYAKLGLAQVELLARIDGLDPIETSKQADLDLGNLELQIQAADCEIAQGDFARASERLIGVIKLTTGDEKKKVRDHLLVLFTLVDPEDPLLAKARQKLASALF